MKSDGGRIMTWGYFTCEETWFLFREIQWKLFCSKNMFNDLIHKKEIDIFGKMLLNAEN